MSRLIHVSVIGPISWIYQLRPIADYQKNIISNIFPSLFIRIFFQSLNWEYLKTEFVTNYCILYITCIY